MKSSGGTSTEDEMGDGAGDCEEEEKEDQDGVDIDALWDWI